MESNEQEKSNLLNDNPIAAQAGGSWLSKHMGGRVSPLQSKGSMAYQKEDEGSPAELTKEGQKKILSSETANPAFKAAIAKETPVAMNNGALYQFGPETPPKEEEKEKPKVKKKIIKFPKIKLPKPPKGTRLSKKEIKKLKN